MHALHFVVPPLEFHLPFCVSENENKIKLTESLHEGWGLSHGNYFFFLPILIDHEETWKYTNGSGWC